MVLQSGFQLIAGDIRTTDDNGDRAASYCILRLDETGYRCGGSAFTKHVMAIDEQAQRRLDFVLRHCVEPIDKIAAEIKGDRTRFYAASGAIRERGKVFGLDDAARPNRRYHGH